MVDFSKKQSAPIEDSGAPLTDLDRAGVKTVLTKLLRTTVLCCLGSEAVRVANCYGIPACPIVMTKTVEEAAAEADKMGYSVVLKIASPEILHKTDVGGLKDGMK